MPQLKARIKAELRGSPRKIGSYLRYDLIEYDKHIFAVPQELGPVDLIADGVPAPGSGILVGHSRRELKLRIAICRLLFRFRRGARPRGVSNPRGTSRAGIARPEEPH